MSSYDENLLASAPKATRAQLQDGYNPDLLAEKTSSTPTIPHVDPELANHRPAAVQREDVPLTKTPFYGTKKGIIIIVVVIVVIIAAVVGGAVGGTRKKNSLNLSSPISSTQGSGSTRGSGGGNEQGTAGSNNPASTNSHTTVTVTTTPAAANSQASANQGT